MSALSPLLRLVVCRWRNHPVRSAIGVVGIAAGVGLMSAVLTINANLVSGYERVERALAGGADLVMATRSPDGVEQALFRQVADTHGVRGAAPIVERSVVLSHAGRNVEVKLVGVDRRLARVGGPIAQAGLSDARDVGAVGLYLSARIAQRLGARPGDVVTSDAGGRRRRVGVVRVLREDTVGRVAESSLAVAPLGLAQQLTGATGRIDRILVATGSDAGIVRARLVEMMDAAMAVRAVGTESDLLSQASAVDRQAAGLFSAVSLVVAVLLAYNLLLLTVLERRREVAMLRMLGSPPRALVAALVLEAAVIGVAGSALGLALGTHVLLDAVGHTPVYLRSAFTFQPATETPVAVMVASVAAGVGAAIAASIFPARALLRIPPALAFRDDHVSDASATPLRAPARALAAAGSASALLGPALALASPSLALAGMALLIGGIAAFLPFLVPRVLALLRRVMTPLGGWAQLAAAELAAVPARAATLAGIGAVTALAVVVIGGAVANLETGTSALARSTYRNADLWVSLDRASNEFLTQPIDASVVGQLARLDAVDDVSPYRSAFLDWRGRRVLVFGFEPGPASFDSKTALDREPAALSRALRRPGTAAVSASLAAALGLRVGQAFSLPTPTGRRKLRLVGTITSYGWQPGALAMSNRQFVDLWDMQDVTAVKVETPPGMAPAHARRIVASALSRRDELRVETAAQARKRTEAVARQGLGQLRDIAALVVAVAAIAVAAAMIAAVAQRTRRLAWLRAVGMDRGHIVRALLTEGSVIVLLGTAVGLVAGSIAQAMAVAWIAKSSSFPATYEPVGAALAAPVAIATAIAVVAGLVSTHRALRIAPARALSPE